MIKYTVKIQKDPNKATQSLSFNSLKCFFFNHQRFALVSFLKFIEAKKNVKRKRCFYPSTDDRVQMVDWYLNKNGKKSGNKRCAFNMNSIRV